MRVSTRSVRRYLVTLRDQLGLEPVPTAPGGPNRWRVKPSEQGRAITLRRTQAYLLLAARKTLRAAAWERPLRRARRRPPPALALGRAPAAPCRARRSTSNRTPGSRSASSSSLIRHARIWRRVADLDDIFRAAAELRVVAFRFEGERVRRLPRMSSPCTMACVACVGLDVAKRELRVFHSRWHPRRRGRGPAVRAPARFRPRDGSCSAPSAPCPPPTSVRAVIEFDARVADEVRSRKHHPDQRIATAADGRVRLAIPVGSRAALVRWVLGFGSAARVIEPDDVADLVREELREALRKAGG